MNLRTHKCLNTHYGHLHNTGTLKIVYHNVQSLHAHFEVLRNDLLMLNADILCFVETWTLRNESYDIPGFKVLPGMRLDSSDHDNRRCKRGLIVYVKNEIYAQYKLHKQVHAHNKTLELMVFQVRNINIIVLYRNKNYTLHCLHEDITYTLNSIGFEKCVLVGDFNICRQRETTTTEALINNNRLSSILNSPTTKGLSQIDWCFSNIDRSVINALTYETVYSYHDAICVTISN